jgi:hypothetical protein
MILKALIVALALLIYMHVFPQQTRLMQFIPEGYTILDSASGNLNFDGYNDMVLVLAVKGEDTIHNNPPKRLVEILYGKEGEGYSLATKSLTCIYTRDMGGVSFSDPYSGIKTDKGSFTILLYGGMGSGQWSLDVTFKFQGSNSNWHLDQTDYSLYKIDFSEENDSQSIEVADNKVKTAKDFGLVRFEEFNVFDFNY